jgi:hypothetical protein
MRVQRDRRSVDTPVPTEPLFSPAVLIARVVTVGTSDVKRLASQAVELELLTTANSEYCLLLCDVTQ